MQVVDVTGSSGIRARTQIAQGLCAFGVGEAQVAQENVAAVGRAGAEEEIGEATYDRRTADQLVIDAVVEERPSVFQAKVQGFAVFPLVLSLGEDGEEVASGTLGDFLEVEFMGAVGGAALGITIANARFGDKFFGEGSGELEILEGGIVGRRGDQGEGLGGVGDRHSQSQHGAGEQKITDETHRKTRKFRTGLRKFSVLQFSVALKKCVNLRVICNLNMNTFCVYTPKNENSR